MSYWELADGEKALPCHPERSLPSRSEGRRSRRIPTSDSHVILGGAAVHRCDPGVSALQLHWQIEKASGASAPVSSRLRPAGCPEGVPPSPHFSGECEPLCSDIPIHTL
jgi:hypothetical protein